MYAVAVVTRYMPKDGAAPAFDELAAEAAAEAVRFSADVLAFTVRSAGNDDRERILYELYPSRPAMEAYRERLAYERFAAGLVHLLESAEVTYLMPERPVRYWYVPHEDEPVPVAEHDLPEARLARARERQRLVKAARLGIDRYPEVIAAVADSESPADAEQLVMAELGVDTDQARVILDIQIRRLAAGHQRRLAEEDATLSSEIARLEAEVGGQEPGP